jgi:hypothetical protein
LTRERDRLKSVCRGLGDRESLAQQVAQGDEERDRLRAEVGELRGVRGTQEREISSLRQQLAESRFDTSKQSQRAHALQDRLRSTTEERDLSDQLLVAMATGVQSALAVTTGLTQQMVTRAGKPLDFSRPEDAQVLTQVIGPLTDTFFDAFVVATYKQLPELLRTPMKEHFEGIKRKYQWMES